TIVVTAVHDGCYCCPRWLLLLSAMVVTAVHDDTEPPHFAAPPPLGSVFSAVTSSGDLSDFSLKSADRA
ncbi:MAG: hypothetical protein OSA98_24425, partial [Rubripirellula sp.]|nr:hypothetical protein [Rubripirellula sp.]